ncbi:MAG: disulfide bond formation protein B [Candidatus Paceibacterota bacterium]
MGNLANTTNTVLSIGTVFVQIVSLLILVMIFTKDKGPLARWFSEKSLVLTALVMTGSMLASLFYSEVIGYLPCLLCWYQRIAIYSISVISIVALVKKTGNDVWLYIKTLSFLGIIVALFHVFSRTTNSEVFDCSAVGPSCLQELFTKFGYIDIPVMSLTALFFVILLIINKKRFS